ncbi:MAG TPA: GNAT family acetyltransferase [Burkholderiaceae bacterium]|nr:GNAT family acetyltransferase [Burkholderiaceae bacterium]
MDVREFRMDDFDRVAALWSRAGLLPSLSDERAEIARKLERDPDLFIVGVDAQTIVGAVMGAYDGRRGWIYHLAIDPDVQSRGFGGTLLRELERRLRQKGCLKVNLLIEMDNANVEAFYQRHGYGRDNLIFMEKWLT